MVKGNIAARGTGTSKMLISKKGSLPKIYCREKRIESQVCERGKQKKC